uniref:RanBP2-type domain-containing protein n=1 Tax=Strongyloides stercoralis TaxID=6248 RepID=A0A0K0E380_STRER
MYCIPNRKINYHNTVSWSKPKNSGFLRSKYNYQNYNKPNNPIDHSSYKNQSFKKYNLPCDSLYITNLPITYTKKKLFNDFNFNNLIDRYHSNDNPVIIILRNRISKVSCLIKFITPEAAYYVKETMNKIKYPGTDEKINITLLPFSERKNIYKNLMNYEEFNIKKDLKKNEDFKSYDPPKIEKKPIIVENNYEKLFSKNFQSQTQVLYDDKKLKTEKNEELKNPIKVGNFFTQFNTIKNNEKEENKREKDSLVREDTDTSLFLKDWVCGGCTTPNFFYRLQCYNCIKRRDKEDECL